jgi:hypothetical protein
MVFIVNRRVAFKLCLCLAGTLVSGCLNPSGRSSAAAEEDDIREAVFRYLIEKNQSYESHENLYFLGIERNRAPAVDPPDSLMKRFAGKEYKVKKRSECETSVSGVFDKNTKEEGRIFYAGEISRLPAVKGETPTAFVEGGYFKAGLSSSGNTYTVKKRNGKWIVTADKMHWIS